MIDEEAKYIQYNKGRFISLGPIHGRHDNVEMTLPKYVP